MKKFGFATIAASGLAAAVLGLAAPATAAVSTGLTSTTISTDLDHRVWIDQIGPAVTVPHVDTGVHQGR